MINNNILHINNNIAVFITVNNNNSWSHKIEKNLVIEKNSP